MIIIPTLFSLLRIILTPLVVVLFLQRDNYLLGCIIIFTLAALTDMLDGYFARLYKVTSFWGAFLDPFADKVLIGSTLICFVSIHIIEWWVIITILLRDTAIMALRLIAKDKGIPLKTTLLAKSKTIMQLVLIYAIFLWLCVHDKLTPDWQKKIALTITIASYVVVFVTVYTACDYGVQFARRLKAQKL